MGRRHLCVAVGAFQAALFMLQGGCVSADRREAWNASTRTLKVASNLKPDFKLTGGDEHLSRHLAITYAKARLDAARELVEGGDREAAERLAGLLAEDKMRGLLDDDSQVDTFLALHRCAPELSEKTLATILHSLYRNDKLHFKYHGPIRALRQVAPERAAEELERGIQEGRWDFVRGYVEVLKNEAPDESGLLLKKLLGHDDRRLRLLAAIELAEHGNAGGLSVLKESARAERTDDIELLGDQRLTVNALGELFEAGGREVLVGMLDDKRVFSALGPTRFCDIAAWEIAKRAGPEDVPLVLRIHGDDFENVRHDALRTLLQLDPENVKPLVRKAFEKGEVNIRMWAAGVLARDGNTEAVAYLERSCLQNLGMGGTAAEYLLTAGTKESILAYLRVLRMAKRPDESEASRRAAVTLKYSFERCSLEHLLPVAEEVAFCGNCDVESAFWLRLVRLKPPIDKVIRILEEGMRKDEEIKRYWVFPCTRSASITTAGHRGQAAAILEELAGSPNAELTLLAVEAGHEKKLVSPETVRKTCLALSAGPRLIRSLRLLSEVAQPEDIPQLRRLLDPNTYQAPAAPEVAGGGGAPVSVRPHLGPVYAAIAIRKTIRRAQK